MPHVPMGLTSSASAVCHADPWAHTFFQCPSLKTIWFTGVHLCCANKGILDSPAYTLMHTENVQLIANIDRNVFAI